MFSLLIASLTQSLQMTKVMHLTQMMESNKDVIGHTLGPQQVGGLRPMHYCFIPDTRKV